MDEADQITPREDVSEIGSSISHGGRRRLSDSALRAVALSDTKLNEICDTVCGCPLACSARLLAKQTVRSLIEKTFSYTPKERGSVIFQELQSFAVDDDKSDKRTIKYKVGSRQCCELVWRLAHGYSKHHAEKARARVLSRKITFRTPPRRKQKLARVDFAGTAEINAAAWLLSMANDLGDKMPVNGLIRVPFATKTQVHDEYIRDMGERKGEKLPTVALQTFTKIWSHDQSLTKIVVTPKRSGFPECSDCGSFRRRLEVPGLSKSAIAEIKAERKAHLDLQRGERKAYADHRELAHRFPERYCCIILDGMELSKSTVPRMARELKSTECVPMNARFVQRLLGVKIHHNGETRHLGYVFPPWVGGGSANAICEVVMRVIEEIGAQRPTHLFVQVDNCSENKCKTLLALADLLVERNIFEKVQFNFLVVGHTHEDIDQWFSTFSKKISHKDVWTPNKMLYYLSKMSDRAEINPKVVFVSSRHDFKGWLKDCIDPELAYYGRGIAPHEFLFCRLNGKVQMKYKPWAQSETYLPDGEDGIKVVTREPTATPLFDKFDGDKWGEKQEDILDACRVVIEQACYLPGTWDEWLEYWRLIPANVDLVQDKWEFSTVKPLAVEPVVPPSTHDVPVPAQQFRDSRVVVAHAGLPRIARNRLVRALNKEQNLRLEADHAKTLRPLAAREYVAFIVDADFWDQPGFTAEEKKLKLCIGRLLNDEETVDPDVEVQVSLYRCASGDINNTWIPAIRHGSKQSVRVIGIPRGSIIYHAGIFLTTSRKLLATVKRGMGSYFLCPYNCPNKDATLVLRK